MALPVDLFADWLNVEAVKVENATAKTKIRISDSQEAIAPNISISHGVLAEELNVDPSLIRTAGKELNLFIGFELVDGLCAVNNFGPGCGGDGGDSGGKNFELKRMTLRSAKICDTCEVYVYHSFDKCVRCGGELVTPP